VLRQVTVFTWRCVGNERDAVWRHRGLLCNNAQCCSARDGTARRRHCLPPPRSAYSVARRLAVGYLATLGCVIQEWVTCHSIYSILTNRSYLVKCPRKSASLSVSSLMKFIVSQFTFRCYSSPHLHAQVNGIVPSFLWECLRISGKETRPICDSHENPPLHINRRIRILHCEVRCINSFHAEYHQKSLSLVRYNVVYISESVRNRGKKIWIRITERCVDVERQNVKFLWEREFRYYCVAL
jgi:hypothetical protein